MRYMTANRLTEGMIVGRPFFGIAGNVILQKGFRLTESSIRRLREMQYEGVYIEEEQAPADETPEDIQVVEILSGELRSNVTHAVSRLLTNIELDHDTHFDDDMRQLSDYLDSALDEILSSSSKGAISVVDIKDFDLYTYQHSVNVCVLACVIGMAQNLSRAELRQLGLAALLHDIGKVFVDKKILNKPGKLTPEEFAAMKQHPTLGYEYLEKKKIFPKAVTTAVWQHHEHYHGGGYPLGLQGQEITTFAQIITVADVYDAVTSARPYHEAILPSEAYEYIMGNSGQLFSWDVVATFTKKIAPFPLGMRVLLSDGRMGVVYKNHDDFLTRPLIRLMPTQGAPQGARFIDLKEDASAHNITIQQIFP